MKVIEAPQVDLIEPFPTGQVARATGWLHCYKTLLSTPTPDELTAFLVEQPQTHTWGIIDKFQKLNTRHEAPLIGFVRFEEVCPTDGYLDTACTRKAAGSKLLDDAIRTVIDTVFTGNPEMQRISVTVADTNDPAKALLWRLGFSLKGVLRDGHVLMFGLHRRGWTAPVPAV